MADEDGQAQIAESWGQGEFVAMPMGSGEIGDPFKLFQAIGSGANQSGKKAEN